MERVVALPERRYTKQMFRRVLAVSVLIQDGPLAFPLLFAAKSPPGIQPLSSGFANRKHTKKSGAPDSGNGLGCWELCRKSPLA